MQVLEARQGVAQAKLDMESSSLSLKSYIGLNENTTLNLVLPSEIPDFDVDVQKAIEYAFQTGRMRSGLRGKEQKLKLISLEQRRKISNEFEC